VSPAIYELYAFSDGSSERKTSRAQNQHFRLELLRKFWRSPELQAFISSFIKRMSCWISFVGFNGRPFRTSIPSAKMFSAKYAFQIHQCLFELRRYNLAFSAEREILGIGS